MRRQLIVVFVAVSLMVAIAFVVPLGFLVRNTAEDRAIDAARSDASAVVPTLVAGSSQDQIEAAVGATASGQLGRLTVVTAGGLLIGPEVQMSERFETALARGVSSFGPVDGGVEVVTAVATGPGELSAVRVFVPETELRRGQSSAWAALAGVAAALVLLSVLVADRLARSIVRPTQDLAIAAHRLGEGDLASRVEPAGPPELVELSETFNLLGTRVTDMLTRERELVAELSHRLRTPLTKLRLRVDQVDDDALAEELRSDISDLTVVVNDLIAEARATLGDTDASCDLAEVLRDRVDFWAPLAEDTEREWSFVTGPTPMYVPLSAASLQAVVDVLIENVFSHTEEGTPFVVGFGTAAENRARFWVGDAGPGVDSSAVERGVSGASSTGLGLDIARNTAANTGGSFDLGTSELGGAEISVTVPILTHRPPK